LAKELLKKVIMPKELFEAPVAAFFQEIGWELADAITENDKAGFVFILNDYLPNISDYPRVKTNPLLTFAPQIEKCVRGTFDEKYIANANVKALLKAQFEAGPEFDFIDRYSQNLKQVYIFKLHDFLNVGYFTDTMVIEAYKSNFDFEIIRSYLNDFFTYCLKQVEYNDDQKFIEVTYSVNEQAFALQVNFDKSEFSLNNEEDNFKKYIEKSNYFDVNYFSKRKRVTLSTLWFKDITLKKFQAHFYNETTTRIQEETTLIVKSGLEPKEDVHYMPADRDQGKKLSLARKFALFIKNYRNGEEAPKPIERLEFLDVEYYMSLYPRQDALAEIDDELKHFVLKLLKDENLYDGISDVVKKISDSGLEDHSNEIQKILSGKSLSDIDETLKISGKKEDIGEGFTRIQGNPDEQDNHKEVISGVTQDLTNDEKWEIKKGQIGEKINEEIIRIKSEGRNVVQDDIIKIVSKQLDVEEDDVKFIVSGIVEEAIAPSVVKSANVAEGLQAAKEEARAYAAATEANKEKLESQVLRMKKIMEQMKQEMLRLRQENKHYSKISGVGVPETNADSLRLKTALSKTMSILKGKEKFLEKMKHDHETIIKSKDSRLASLEARIEGMKTSFAQSAEQVNAEKLIYLENENKNLHAKIEHANKKLNVINDNIDNKENELLIKKDKELATLKQSVNLAQSLIEKFKNEKNALEQKLVTERDIVKKVREDFEAKLKTLNVADHSKFADELHDLSVDKKALEEKYKLQAIELKKLEQKLKFTTSQLESSQKKKNAPATGQKSNEAYLKQLESANSRLSDATLEIAEKKKEALKLKQENTVLAGKITELERKLNIADKKAA
jgi:hypothetical protein